jgi:hypothetical protein
VAVKSQPNSTQKQMAGVLKQATEVTEQLAALLQRAHEVTARLNTVASRAAPLDDPGDPPMGACLLSDGVTCRQTTQAECDAVNGTWFQGGLCPLHPAVDSGKKKAAKRSKARPMKKFARR